MTKAQFSNVSVGIQVRNLATGIHYRIRERIARTLVLVRIDAIASAPLVEIARLSQCHEWGITEGQK